MFFTASRQFLATKYVVSLKQCQRCYYARNAVSILLSVLEQGSSKIASKAIQAT